MKIHDFGEHDGKRAHLLEMKNASGTTVEVITYGAILKSVMLRDKHGGRIDVVTGFDNLQGYVNDTVSMGATIGRVANRIGNARFCLEGKEFLLAANDGAHHIHGGGCLSKRIWDFEAVHLAEGDGVRLTTMSFNGECGYPADVLFEVLYTLTADDKLNIRLRAKNLCEQKTIVNMTNHSYFNLEESDSIYGHVMKLDADSYLPVDDSGLVTGEVTELNGKLAKLKNGVPLREVAKNGIIDIDNDFILRTNGSLRLESPKSGIRLTMTTTNPIAHIYCAQFLHKTAGKNGKVYNKCCAIAIEPQKHTNAVNVSHFPSIVLDGFGEYDQDISYSFTTAEG